MPRWPRGAQTAPTTHSPPVIDYDAVYRRTSDSVYRICLSVLRDPEAAADATMEVFKKLLSRPPRRDLDNLEGWLRVAARTTAIDHLRSLRRHVPLDDARDVFDPMPTPEEIVLDDDARRSLHDRLATLPAAQRQVIELRLEGLSGDEIARLLGRNRGWVDTTAFRALQRLRAEHERERRPVGQEGRR